MLLYECECDSFLYRYICCYTGFLLSSVCFTLKIYYRYCERMIPVVEKTFNCKIVKTDQRQFSNVSAAPVEDFARVASDSFLWFFDNFTDKIKFNNCYTKSRLENVTALLNSWKGNDHDWETRTNKVNYTVYSGTKHWIASICFVT